MFTYQEVIKRVGLSTIKIALTGLFISLTFSTVSAQNGNLTVKVVNFKNNKGNCRFWLFNSAAGFPDEKKALKIAEVPITGNISQFVFEDLPPGKYAVSVLHDENGNHKFDTNFLGIPKEHYGNSNGARGGMSGPPKFEQCSFIHARTGTTITIKVE